MRSRGPTSRAPGVVPAGLGFTETRRRSEQAAGQSGFLKRSLDARCVRHSPPGAPTDPTENGRAGVSGRSGRGACHHCPARPPPVRRHQARNDPSFLPPGDMPARIAAACLRLDQPAPGSRARRPIRSLWLRRAPPMTFTRRSIAAIVVLAIAPAYLVVSGLRVGDLATVGYGLAAMVGAVGAVYAVRAMDPDAARSTIRTTLITGSVLVGIVAAARLASGGFTGNLAAAVATTVFSVATYVPVVFVIEEVVFRGLLDSYLHGSTPGPDRASAFYGSALWGLWHLPVTFVSLGLLTIPYLVIVHTTIGYFLVTSWRRTGNLAAPGIAHALSTRCETPSRSCSRSFDADVRRSSMTIAGTPSWREKAGARRSSRNSGNGTPSQLTSRSLPSIPGSPERMMFR